MIVQFSERLKNKISEALSGTESCVFAPLCIFSNPDTGYKYTCRFITDLIFVQDFLGAYMDNIQVTFNVTPDELREMLSNMQNLECTLILRPVNDSSFQLIPEQESIIYETKVFIDDQVDLAKKFNINAFGVGDNNEKQIFEQSAATFPYTVHLIEHDAYNMRHVQLNSMFNDTDVESILHWSSQCFGAENVQIVPPNNKHKYSNLIIPPMHDISSLYPFLQERYGIYSKGLGYYFSDKTLYIYPAFDTDRNTSPVEGVVHILNAPEKYFLGMNRYHCKKDDDILLVSVTRADVKPLNTEGSENFGNVHVSVNADGTRDNFMKIGNDGKVTRNTKDITMIQMQNSAGNMNGSMQNMHYQGERSNIYVSTSKMAAYDGTLLRTGWLKAIPRLLKPGQNICYHFDETGSDYKVQDGRILRVVYTGKLHSGSVNETWMTFSANIEAKLDPDFKSEEEIQVL